MTARPVRVQMDHMSSGPSVASLGIKAGRLRIGISLSAMKVCYHDVVRSKMLGIIMKVMSADQRGHIMDAAFA
jgi:hypothetical protein